jgi:dolichol-phosphate mannosyltransferase
MRSNGVSLVSIVIPVYNEEESIPALYERLAQLAQLLPQHELEFIFADDGSRDHSLDTLTELARQDPRVKVVSLSRNFGSHAALRAGFAWARGQAIANISGDLQDPPELIATLVREWEQGTEIVWGVRAGRDDALADRLFAGIYYRLMRTFALKEMPLGGMDLCLMDRKVLDTIAAMPEKNTTIFGLILWSGYRQKFIPYRRQTRRYGVTKWALDRRIKMFTDSFVSFSAMPLRIWTYLGGVILVLGIVGGVAGVGRAVAHGPGALNLLAFSCLVMLSGLQLIALGIFGEYLWHAFDQSRPRPMFIVRETIGFDR